MRPALFDELAALGRGPLEAMLEAAGGACYLVSAHTVDATYATTDVRAQTDRD